MTLQSANQGSLDNHKAAMTERAELHILKKKCEERIKDLDAELRPVLAGRGEITYNGYSFKVVETAGRKTFDKVSAGAAMKEKGLSIDDYYVTGAPSTTFTVKEVNSI